MRNFSMLNFFPVNFQNKSLLEVPGWVLGVHCAVLLVWNIFTGVLSEIFSISDETDCKTSSRAVADPGDSEWQGDKLYIILGEIY